MTTMSSMRVGANADVDEIAFVIGRDRILMTRLPLCCLPSSPWFC